MATSVLRTLSLRIVSNSAAFRKDIDQVDKRLARFSSRTTRAAHGIQQSFVKMFLAWKAFDFSREALHMADAMQDLRNRMGATFDEAEKVSAGMADIKRIARESRMDLLATGSLYQRIAISTKAMGASLEDVAAITQVVANTFQLSGTSGSEAANSARQFAQGLASGALKGDEFRSVSENNVVLTQLLAEGLNMTVGQLKAYAAAGGLTAEKIREILVPALEKTNAQIAEMPMTWKQATTNLKTATTIWIDNINQQYKVAQKLSAGIQWVTENITLLAKVLVGSAYAAVAFWLTRAMAPLVLSFVRLATVSLLSLVTIGTGLPSAFAKATKAITAFVAVQLPLYAMAGAMAIVAAAVAAIAAGAITAYMQWDRLVKRFETYTIPMLKNLGDSLASGWNIVMQGIAVSLNWILKEITDWAQKLVPLLDALSPVSDLAGSIAEGLRGVATDMNEQYEASVKTLDELLARNDELIKQRERLAKMKQDGTIPDLSFGDAFKEIVTNAASGLGLDISSFEAFIDSVGSQLERLLAMMPGGQAILDFLMVGEQDPDSGFQAWLTDFGTYLDSLEEKTWTWAERMANAAAYIKGAWQNVWSNIKNSIDVAAKSYDSWGDILAAGAEKSKSVLAIQKAIAIGMLTYQKAVAMGKALSELPFPTNLLAAAKIAAQFALLLGDISSGKINAASPKEATVKGQTHDGIDSVPSTGTYLLERGERVVDRRLNADLKDYLKAPGTNMAPAQVHLHVNGVSDPDVVVQALASRRGELESMMRRIALDGARNRAL